MPLTPFHLAVGLPIKKSINIWAFILVNILIDLEPGLIMFFGMGELGYPLHQGIHTLGGATLMIGITTIVWAGFRTTLFKHWFLGAVLGGYSHIFLDALVHSDVEPFAPLLSGNPLYLDIHAEVTILCAVVLAYYLMKGVESLRVGEVVLPWCSGIWRKFFSRTLGE